MKEAPLFRGGFSCFSDTPFGNVPGGGSVFTGCSGGPSFGPSGFSSGTWNLVWNFGI